MEFNTEILRELKWSRPTRSAERRSVIPEAKADPIAWSCPNERLCIYGDSESEEVRMKDLLR